MATTTQKRYMYEIHEPDGSLGTGGAYSRRRSWTNRAAATRILKRSNPGSLLIRLELVDPTVVARAAVPSDPVSHPQRAIVVIER
jgi:hypothetical protein